VTTGVRDDHSVAAKGGHGTVKMTGGPVKFNFKLDFLTCLVSKLKKCPFLSQKLMKLFGVM
jgi:hypothetical protein